MNKSYFLSLVALLLTGCAGNPSSNGSSLNPSSSTGFDGKYSKGELVYTFEQKTPVSHENEEIEITVEQLKDHKLTYKIDRENNDHYLKFDDYEMNLNKFALINAFVGDIDCDSSLDVCVNLKLSASSGIKKRVVIYSLKKKSIIYEANENYSEASFDSYELKVNEEKELIVEQYDKKKNVSIYPLKYGRFLNNYNQEMSLEWANYDLKVYNIEPDMTDPATQKTRTRINGKWGFTVSKDTSYSLMVFADLVGDFNERFNEYHDANFFALSYKADFYSQLEAVERGGNYVYTRYAITFSKTGTTELIFTMLGYSEAVIFTVQ